MKYATSAEVFGLKVNAIKNCWAIDKTSKAAGGADNGFLDCARAHTPGFMSHGTTAECATNLSNCLGVGQGIANIVGHGNDGLIVTGQGQAPSDPNKFITTWNENIWGPLLKSLKGKAGTIKLWACHPGTAQAGADLLYAMMLETNATCLGPTGFLYCSNNGLYLEANSTWQISSPGHPKPPPIKAPTPHFQIARDKWSLRISDGHMINLGDVQSVEFRRGQQSLLLLRDEMARGVLRFVDFASPVQIDGVLGAIVTAEIVITISAQGRPRELKFLVYNNRLLVSEGEPPSYYRCSEGFVEALTSGLRP